MNVTALSASCELWRFDEFGYSFTLLAGHFGGLLELANGRACQSAELLLCLLCL
jgi:hypothetical protein